MRKKPVKIGLIGAGRMGQNHLRVLSMLGSASIEFVYDVDPAALNRVASIYGIKPVDGLEDALRQVDGVVICSPTVTHFDYVMLAGRYVKNIFVEKPIADSLDKAREIALFAEAAGLNIQVGFIERFNPAVRELRKIIAKSGRIINIDFTRTNKLSSHIKDVDVISDVMIHDIDLALCLNGPAERVHAYGVVDEGLIAFAIANIQHKNGGHSRILASKMTEKKTRLIQATCESSFIDCELLRKEILISKQSIVEQKLNEPYTITSIEEAVEVRPQEALLNELQAFIALCDGERTDIPDQNDGLAACELCNQIQEMIRREL